VNGPLVPGIGAASPPAVAAQAVDLEYGNRSRRLAVTEESARIAGGAVAIVEPSAGRADPSALGATVSNAEPRP